MLAGRQVLGSVATVTAPFRVPSAPLPCGGPGGGNHSYTFSDEELGSENMILSLGQTQQGLKLEVGTGHPAR